jgi:hypothetical protein
MKWKNKQVYIKWKKRNSALCFCGEKGMNFMQMFLCRNSSTDDSLNMFQRYKH